MKKGSKHTKRFKKEQGKRKGRSYCGWKDYQRKRKAHFKKYFFGCICLWEDELKKPQKIMNKIFRFTLLKGGLRK